MIRDQRSKITWRKGSWAWSTLHSRVSAPITARIPSSIDNLPYPDWHRNQWILQTDLSSAVEGRRRSHSEYDRERWEWASECAWMKKKWEWRESHHGDKRFSKIVFQGAYRKWCGFIWEWRLQDNWEYRTDSTCAVRERLGLHSRLVLMKMKSPSQLVARRFLARNEGREWDDRYDRVHEREERGWTSEWLNYMNSKPLSKRWIVHDEEEHGQGCQRKQSFSSFSYSLMPQNYENTPNG